MVGNVSVIFALRYDCVVCVIVPCLLKRDKVKAKLEFRTMVS